MTEKELLIKIYQFVRINPKKNKFYFWRKYKIKSFDLIQDIYKNCLTNLNHDKYNNLFYNKKKKISLSGQEFINQFINCQDVNEYIQKIKIKYPNCQTKKFHKILIQDIFRWYYYDKQSNLLEEIEVNFDKDIKVHLVKIRTFLKTKEWKYYFFELQSLMHKTIVTFLVWKNKPLNYSAYSKVLKRKLFYFLQSEARVDHFLAIVQTINFYRNILIKIAPGNWKDFNEWNELNEVSKVAIAWELYFGLTELIHFTNLKIEENNDEKEKVVTTSDLK